MKHKYLAVLVLLTFFLACTQQAEEVAPGAEINPQETGAQVILIKSFAFAPEEIKVKAGTEVTWRNEDSVSHTVVSDSGDFESSTLRKGEEFSFTFSEAGEYSYHCGIHPSMKGKVIVE